MSTQTLKYSQAQLGCTSKKDAKPREIRHADRSAVKQASAWARKRYAEAFKKLAE